MVPPGIAPVQFTSSVFPDGETYRTLRPGDPLAFRLHGDLHGVYVIAHPDVGCIEVAGNGEIRRVSLFDRWCTNPPRPRMKVVVFDRPLTADGARITARLTDHVPDLPVLAASTPPAAAPEAWTFDPIGLLVDGTVEA